MNYNQIPNVSKQAIAFAQACEDQNTIAELLDAATVDMIDCYTWEITADEWRWAVGAALYAKQNDGSIMDSGRVVF
jgi:hypothetical protein